MYIFCLLVVIQIGFPINNIDNNNNNNNICLKSNIQTSSVDCAPQERILEEKGNVYNH